MTDLTPETNPLGKHKAELPDAANPNLEADKPETSEALVETIEGGIDDARERRGDITEHTARAIARVAANALGDEGRYLDAFARTGSGEYVLLSEEYLEVYNDPTAPAQVRIWIDWLGTYLVMRDFPDTSRQYMGPSPDPDLSRLLIPQWPRFGDDRELIYVPATKTGDDIHELAIRLAALVEKRGDTLRAFLRLSDVDASSPNLIESFEQTFCDTYLDMDDVVRNVTEISEWETELEAWAGERGITGAVYIDRAAIEEQTREVYDIVELEGRFHVFHR
ncbi:hypothetical protein BH10ACT7_BH10ACT7_11000 [soil metagenome]